MKIETSPHSKTLYIWNSVSAVFYYGGITPPHSHNTMQLVFDLGNGFRCKLANTGWETYKNAIIKENAIHQLDPNNGLQLLVYLEPETMIAGKLRAKYLSVADIASIDIDLVDHIKAGELEKCLIETDHALLQKLVQHLLGCLIDKENAGLPDERVKKVIKLLAMDNIEKMPVSYLAKKVFLSESRLRSLFKKTTGIPLHRYIIWNKIMQAIGRIVNGATVQDAAIECGFSDSSHFHRLLLQMFGVSPSQFIKNNSIKNIQVLSPYPMSIESRFFEDESGIATRVYKS
ncbi:MAG: helix-turn-helix transcriptional regulator [Ferruginibacter sp.]